MVVNIPFDVGDTCKDLCSGKTVTVLGIEYKNGKTTDSFGGNYVNCILIYTDRGIKVCYELEKINDLTDHLIDFYGV